MDRQMYTATLTLMGRGGFFPISEYTGRNCEGHSSGAWGILMKLLAGVKAWLLALPQGGLDMASLTRWIGDAWCGLICCGWCGVWMEVTVSVNSPVLPLQSPNNPEVLQPRSNCAAALGSLTRFVILVGLVTLLLWHFNKPLTWSWLCL